MDDTDKKILRILQQDSTLAINELASKVNLSSTPCWKRVKRLEQMGVIRARVALLNPAKLDLSISVFVHLKTSFHDAQWIDNFAKSIESFDEIIECYRMAGEWDYLLRVVVRDISDFDQFYKRLISKVEGLADITSNFSMEEMKYTTELPL